MNSNVSSSAAQQQTPSMTNPPGSQLIGSAFFESPLLSNTMIEYATRQLSPPTSTSFLTSVLPDTPGKGKSSMGSLGSMDAGGLDQAKLKKSAAVVSNLMNAERQTQKKKDPNPIAQAPSTASSGNSISTTRLFAPLEQSGGMRPPPSSSVQSNNSSGHSAMLGSNLIRPSRLSVGLGEESFLDLPFGTDFGYSFSPGEIVRSLGTNAISESPLTQNLRMYPYSQSYSSMMAPTQHSMTSTPSWPQQYQQPQQRQYMPSSYADASKVQQKKRSTKKDDDDDDEDRPKKKAKKAPKPEDPNEPRITSKHRGVCWYKRTKKWVVQTKVNGKRVHVGYFDDEEKAAEAYKNAVQGIQVKKALEAKQKSMGEQLA